MKIDGAGLDVDENGCREYGFGREPMPWAWTSNTFDAAGMASGGNRCRMRGFGLNRCRGHGVLDENECRGHGFR